MDAHRAAAPARQSWVEQIMGMPISLLARGPVEAFGPADAAAAEVFAELRSVDAMFSPYVADSAISRIRAGTLDLASSPELVRDVAERCLRARALTDGLFDATRPDGTWDPSGLVKGWAAERAARHLTAAAGLDWCLNAGGDVVVQCDGGRSFAVGIQNPADPARLAERVIIAGGAVATSGTAARGAHIYDPRTGAAASHGLASVTVVGPSLETADVLATAAFVAGTRWAQVVSLVTGYAGLAITSDGGHVPTPNWPRR